MGGGLHATTTAPATSAASSVRLDDRLEGPSEGGPSPGPTQRNYYDRGLLSQRDMLSPMSYNRFGGEENASSSTEELRRLRSEIEELNRKMDAILAMQMKPVESQRTEQQQPKRLDVD